MKDQKSERIDNIMIEQELKLKILCSTYMLHSRINRKIATSVIKTSVSDLANHSRRRQHLPPFSQEVELPIPNLNIKKSYWMS